MTMTVPCSVERSRLTDDGRDRRLNLVAVVAHDLRQPLTAALMAAEVVEESLDDASAAPAARKALALAKRCVRETLRLASDLLAMEQAEDGMLRLRPNPVDVALLLRDVRALVTAQAGSRQIDVRIHTPRALPRPIADRDRLLQVLMNLCGNAVKFTRVGGSVVLAAACHGGDVHVSVSDTGPGVADHELPHVFEPYWQGAHADETGGAGLGLTIAKRLVEAHGGCIVAERALGGGLRVVFTIPLAAPLAAA
jgi:signal transduction histidine kinase